MKYIQSAFLAFVLFTGYGLFDMYKKLATASALAETLKASNMKLSKKNKALTANNKKLIAREKHIHKKITQRRAKLTKANLKRAQKKLATAGAKMAPYLGMPVVVGATAYDINEYCSNIDEMEQFEYELFGDVTLSNYDKTVCGVDVQGKLQQTARDVTHSYDAVLKSFNKQNHQASLYWSRKYRESTQFLTHENKHFNQFWNEKYSKTAKYLSEQNDGAVSFWKDEYEDLKSYW